MSGSGKQCECCGQPLPNGAGFRVEHHVLIQGTKRLRISAKRAAMLEAMLDAYPRAVHRDYLIARVWPMEDEPGDPENVLKHMRWAIRKRTGIDIDHKMGMYWINGAEVQRAAA